jgi:hypothetical protein
MIVTPAITASLEWLVLGEVQRKLMDEFVNGIDLPCGATECTGPKCKQIMRCAMRLSLSPEMRSAID